MKSPTPDAEDAAKIGIRLRSLRDAAGHTNPSLAEALGVTPDAVKKMMNGSALKSYVKLARLARALRTSPNEITGFSVGEVDQRVLDALCGALMASLGLPEARAKALLRAVSKSGVEPAIPVEGASPEQYARIAGGIAARRFLDEQAAQ